ncbi:MAG: elongation factor Tu, partial [Micromonosporaceae bacterium]|nr:elongation factor Tu [Micromonosporaceae bacterium]
RDQVRRGDVIGVPGSIAPHRRFRARAYLLTKAEGGRHTPVYTNYRPQFYFRTTDVVGAVNLGEMASAAPGSRVEFAAELGRPVAIDTGLGFAMREGGRTVGAGTVTELLD